VRARSLGSPRLGHALRVAAMSTLVIASVYVVVTVIVDTVNAERLVAQVDAHLQDRLHDAAREGSLRGPRAEIDDHDVDAAPVLLWSVSSSGHTQALSDNAPRLPRNAWLHSGAPATAQLGSTSFRLIAAPADGGWLIAGQSLAETAHVDSVLVAGEVIAGPVVLLAAFIGALVIGVKASRPIEDARRRQLEFTADASHELRTPLSVIEAEVSLALRAKRDAEQYRQALERVAGESSRLRCIIEDLLWLARFDSEPAPASAEIVDLGVLAKGCVERFRAVARARHLGLSLECHGDREPGLLAPTDWIDRLLGVLVDNACRHAGERGRVLVQVTATTSRLTLSVQDSGPGIPPEEWPRLFDRFHRATSEGTGTGLGLAIADSVVRSTEGRWRIATSSLGGANMEVSWHRLDHRNAGPNVADVSADRRQGDPAASSAKG
jgi:signal transduction histidine kinase